MHKILSFLFWSLSAIAIVACQQEAPEALNHTLNFSGHVWTVRWNEGFTTPGNNFFSRKASDVFIDNNGYLHLKLAKKYSKWYGTEVYLSDTSFLQQGTYIISIEKDIVSMDSNTILRFYTWSEDFYNQANSEFSIDLGKFGNSTSSKSLQYAVHPILDSIKNSYAERKYSPADNHIYSNGSTHAIKLSPNKVEFFSYQGQSINSTPTYYWSFNSINRARIKYLRNNTAKSKEIIVPAFKGNRSIRIGFWSKGNESDFPIGSSDGKDKEIIITKFEFIPL